MKIEEFENHLRQAAENREAPFDTQAFLYRLHRKKRRRTALWIFFGIGAALLIFHLCNLSQQPDRTGKQPLSSQTLPSIHQAPLKQDSDVLLETTPAQAAPEPPPHRGGTPASLPAKVSTQGQWEETPSGVSPIHTQNLFPTIKKERPKAFLHSFQPLPIPQPQLKYFPIPRPYPLYFPSKPSSGIRKKNPLSYHLQAETGLMLSNRRLSAGPGDNRDYLNARRQTEKELETLYFGLYGRLEFADSWYFRTGIAISRIHERVDHKILETYQQEVSAVTEIVISPQGDSTFVTDQVSLTTEREFIKRQFNHLTLIDLPLIMGYRIPLRNISLEVEAGPFINLQLSSRGEILATDGSYMPLSESGLRSQIGWSGYASVRLSAPLGERWRLTGGPAVRYFPRSFSVGDAAVQTRYFHLGLQAGVMVNL